MAENLKLNDGTVLDNSSAILSGDLFLYMNGHGMKEVFDLLIEPEKTKKIVYTRNDGSIVSYLKYKKLISVRDEGDDLITAVLRREVNE
jgi:hypothetical protein